MTQNVELEFFNFGIFINFYFIEIWPVWYHCLTTIISLSKLAKIDQFWHFLLTLYHSKYKRSSLRSQFWMRLFLWFSNTWDGGKIFILLFLWIFVMFIEIPMRNLLSCTQTGEEKKWCAHFSERQRRFSSSHKRRWNHLISRRRTIWHLFCSRKTGVDLSFLRIFAIKVFIGDLGFLW